MAEASGTSDEEEAVAFFQAAVRESDDSFDLNVTLLSEGQAKLQVETLLKWFRSVGGLNRTFGLLRGHSVRRSSWRYQMTDNLLATLVQLVVASEAQGESRIKLGEVLRSLSAVLA